MTKLHYIGLSLIGAGQIGLLASLALLDYKQYWASSVAFDVAFVASIVGLVIVTVTLIIEEFRPDPYQPRKQTLRFGLRMVPLKRRSLSDRQEYQRMVQESYRRRRNELISRNDTQ